ncbi:PREDICTED: uncharacterized protein LOC104771130 [Camelina sativa]|uniref:Uncharacterized protein LOC104736674 n=1 Tax=Camelina sativa TaxID=90675 RepID=A0ABM0VEK9_CAMSA|nr:PREDICTED: uncharacterized protein LOC104736674 [Camelina sativa]XP_010493905.1 PREDICTED: uncharacterized protein LOC104771130 [Camelina sativa]
MAGTVGKMMMVMALVMMACCLQACNGMKVDETMPAAAMASKLECFKTCSISCGKQNKPCYQDCLTKCGVPQFPSKPSSPSTA